MADEQQLLHLLRRDGPGSGRDLRSSLGISQATFSRLVRKCSHPTSAEAR
jgi:DNA-binding MarR family transcriptional regulator